MTAYEMLFWRTQIRPDSVSTMHAATALDQDKQQKLIEANMSEQKLEGKRSAWDEFMCRFNRIRTLAGTIVSDKMAQLLIVILIAINAIMLGIGTFDFVSDNPDVASAFDLVDLIFLIIFTVELGFQLLHHGLAFFGDGWLIFDLIIILMSWSFASIRIIRAFRIFRSLRLLTRIKVMKNMILALYNVMPRMAAIALLLFLIFYIFAVMFTQLFKDLVLSNDYFTRLGNTFFTLFQILTLDSWANISREVQSNHGYKWAWLPFIVFIIISAFIIVNLIIAVICEAIADLHDDEKAKIHGSFQNGNDAEVNSVVPVDIRQQLQRLEEQVVELARTQEQTKHMLEYLARHLQLKNETKNKGGY